MIDTHTHIYLPEFESDRSEVISRAVLSGVKAMILPNVDEGTIYPLEQCCQEYPDLCFPAMGLHPTSVDSEYKAKLNKIEKALSQGEVCAIGEIGLDLYWDRTYIKEQLDALRIQCQWAKELNLPVILHTREAFAEMEKALDDMPFNLKGVFHSYTSDYEQANRLFDLGDFKLGINGVVTFKNSLLKESLPEIGLEKLLLETDAPYLSPVPFRGKRNEPGHLHLIAETLGIIFQQNPDEIKRKTETNARDLFSLKKKSGEFIS